jgi:hypothetical protein
MNQAMSGTCAVGIVLVNGPAGSGAAFLPNEITDIGIGLGKAWDVLYTLSDKNSPVRPRLLFVSEFKVVGLTLDPTTVPDPTTLSPGSSDYNAREPLWRDAALTAMGYSTGMSGVSSYNSYLLNNNWSIGKATSAYTVFITKYNAGWMAYTSIGDAYMVLQYPWLSAVGNPFASTTGPGNGGGWGTNWLMAYAHETGHIFQAPDEYVKSACTRTSVHGALHIPNANCQRTDGEVVTPCLMFANTADVCTPTIRTWGWVDDNHDGVLDVTP